MTKSCSQIKVSGGKRHKIKFIGLIDTGVDEMLQIETPTAINFNVDNIQTLVESKWLN